MDGKSQDGAALYKGYPQKLTAGVSVLRGWNGTRTEDGRLYFIVGRWLARLGVSATVLYIMVLGGIYCFCFEWMSQRSVA